MTAAFFGKLAYLYIFTKILFYDGDKHYLYTDDLRSQLIELFAHEYNVDPTAFGKLFERFYFHSFQKNKCLLVVAMEGKTVAGFQSFFTGLIFIKEKGVGAHTRTHTLVAADSTPENSENEILTSKKIIEDKLDISVDSFCSINDTLLSVGKKEKTLIEKNYSFHFTTLPGYNREKKDAHFIKRRNVECFWPSGAFYYALGRSDLKRWEKKITLYENL